MKNKFTMEELLGIKEIYKTTLDGFIGDRNKINETIAWKKTKIKHCEDQIEFLLELNKHLEFVSILKANQLMYENDIKKLNKLKILVETRIKDEKNKISKIDEKIESMNDENQSLNR